MTTLQFIWFVLVGTLLTVYAVLDGFDLGVGVLHPFIARKESERRTLLAAVGPFWDGNEVWLLTGGGAMFAAFPQLYATVFSGFYLAMMLVLLGLILRAASIEFRSKVESPIWRNVWDWGFWLGSLLPGQSGYRHTGDRRSCRKGRTDAAVAGQLQHSQQYRDENNDH